MLSVVVFWGILAWIGASFRIQQGYRESPRFPSRSSSGSGGSGGGRRRGERRGGKQRHRTEFGGNVNGAALRGSGSALHAVTADNAEALVSQMSTWHSSTSTLILTFGKPWWDDDLPNILGINPLEAAVIFGALYYFYGIDTLYEYARDAGKAFSTYAPIIKEATTNIYTEIVDFLEEDRQRNVLRDQGVDVDSIPRRTTNIFEVIPLIVFSHPNLSI